MDPDHKRRALVQAGIAITSELSLDAVLQTLVVIAADLTAARYSALGVIDRSGRSLIRFVTHGIDDPDPRGHRRPPHAAGGSSGVLIDDARPLRLDDLTRDPRSVGFPPNHPPMHSFLGVPVMTRGVAFGNLYLAEKQPAGELHRRGRGDRHAPRGPGGGCDRERRQRAARRPPARGAGAGGRAAEARA